MMDGLTGVLIEGEECSDVVVEVEIGKLRGKLLSLLPVSSGPCSHRLGVDVQRWRWLDPTFVYSRHFAAEPSSEVSSA